MNDYLTKWYSDLLTRPSYQTEKEVEASGECDKHMGPSYWFAKTKISISPALTIEVNDKLDVEKADYLKRTGWYEQIIFGVLDVLLTHMTAPYRSFRLTILDVEIHDIDSRAIAFRLAARDATRKILTQLGG